MCTARPSWMSISQQKLGYKDRMYRVKVDLQDIIMIDDTDLTVTVEPAVTIGFLNSEHGVGEVRVHPPHSA